jgi:methionyl-tRNA formyltransferase
MLNFSFSPRYVYFGTPDFAVRVLKRLVEKEMLPLLVVTREDKPVGRKMISTPPALKVYAESIGLPVFQPKRLDEEAVEKIAALAPDYLVTASYGALVPKSLLAVPKYPPLNVHGSLLPRYRGAAPIAAAIAAGDDEAGVSIMEMEETLDTGDVFASLAIPIGDDDTTATLEAKLGDLSGDLVISVMADLAEGKEIRIPQDEALATFVPRLTRDSGRLDFSQPAEKLARLVRAMQPWPEAFFSLSGRKIKVVEASAISGENLAAALELKDQSASKPGEVISLQGGITIRAGEGALLIRTIIPAGKGRMPASELAHNLKVGFTVDSPDGS